MTVKLVKLGGCYQIYKDNDRVSVSYMNTDETEQQFRDRVIRSYDDYVKELKAFKEKTEPKVIKTTEI